MYILSVLAVFQTFQCAAKVPDVDVNNNSVMRFDTRTALPSGSSRMHNGIEIADARNQERRFRIRLGVLLHQRWRK